ncbi:hypothetical protein [uncultured Croceitalea sp.]|uniref:hypothetical protein n=1 Tax=uncultured Croceitalea sp. TaxID=1798908 RepID=UPI00374F449C
MAFLIGNVNDIDLSLTRLKSSIKTMDEKEKNIELAEQADTKERKKEIKENFIKNESTDDYVKRIFPKVLGTLLILIVAFAVESSFKEITGNDIFISAETGLTISLVLLLAALNKKLVDFINRFLLKVNAENWIPTLLAGLSLLAILFLGLLSQGGSEGDIKRLFLSLLLLALFYFIVTTSYSKLILDFKYRFGVYIILGMTGLTFLFYIFLLINPTNTATLTLNPLTVINVCLISLFTLMSLIKILGHKWELPLLPMTILVLVLLGIWTANRKTFDHYNVSFVEKKTAVDQRLEIEDYIEYWLEDRKEYIETFSTENKFKVIFVSSEGGGSRAGLWSFLVNSYLYNENNKYFDKHLFSMTGASGGSVGNSMFYSIANHNLHGNDKINLKDTTDNPSYKYMASYVYQNDFLSTSIAALMGRDLFKSITGWPNFIDRGKLLEKEWESSYSNTFNNKVNLKEEFLSQPIISQTSTSPLLIINTVNVQRGEYSLISPVKFSKNGNYMGVFEDFLADYDRVDTKSSAIKMSTAMSLAARFPYISPVGRVQGVGQFMDAGYYDNMGGTVTRRLYDTFNQVLSKCYDSNFVAKIEPAFLIIANNEDKRDSTNCQKIVDEKIKYSTQLTAPLTGVLNATFAQVEEMKKTFGDTYLVESSRQEIKLDSLQQESIGPFADEKLPINPILPLGRYLSRPVIISLEANLEDPCVVEKLQRLLSSKERG